MSIMYNRVKGEKMKNIKFWEVALGQEFVFMFDNGTDWRYRKVAEDMVQCVACPRTARAVGQIDPWKNQNDYEVLVDCA